MSMKMYIVNMMNEIISSMKETVSKKTPKEMLLICGLIAGYVISLFSKNVTAPYLMIVLCIAFLIIYKYNIEQNSELSSKRSSMTTLGLLLLIASIKYLLTKEQNKEIGAGVLFAKIVLVLTIILTSESSNEHMKRINMVGLIMYGLIIVTELISMRYVSVQK